MTSIVVKGSHYVGEPSETPASRTTPAGTGPDFLTTSLRPVFWVKVYDLFSGKLQERLCFAQVSGVLPPGARPGPTCRVVLRFQLVAKYQRRLKPEVKLGEERADAEGYSHYQKVTRLGRLLTKRGD